MKTYDEAVRDVARHQVYMELSHCFTDNELFMSHFGKSVALSVAYGKSYEFVEHDIRKWNHVMRSTLDEWFDEYCKSVEGDE